MLITKCPRTGIHTAAYGNSIASALSAKEAATLCMQAYVNSRPALYTVG